MLQIKTIRNRIDNAVSFDKEVNEALAEGWQLTRRDVLQPKAQSENMQTHIMLYAELEKVVITEKERTCDNCKHCDLDSNTGPCLNCYDKTEGYPSAWEPIE